MGLNEWYENLSRRSVQTAETYRSRLQAFCKNFNVEPEDLVEMDETDVRDLLLRFVSENRDRSAGYVNTVIYAVKSWLEHNSKSVNLKVYLERRSRRESTPTREEVSEILKYASLRTRLIVSLMAFSGLRPMAIGNFKGEDGIRLGDLPELDVEELRFEKVPAQIVVRRELSKAKHQYVTFAGPQTCGYIIAHLRARKMKGRELDEDSPLVATRDEKHLKTAQISAEIAEAMRLAGLDYRPYLLRHYFDTQLLLAEAAGLITEDYRVFWMGHRGDVEHVYTTNKYRLPPQLLEDMREKFSAAVKFLETEREWKESKPKQKVVTTDELSHYLERGWEYVATLPDGRVVVKNP